MVHHAQGATKHQCKKSQTMAAGRRKNMVRGFKPEATRKNEDFARIIRMKLVEHEISRDKIMKATGIGSTTLSHRFYAQKASPAPDLMTVKELRVYCKVLKLSDEDILNFVKG